MSPCRQTVVTPHPSEANFIGPGKRPLSAMSPLIVTDKRTGKLVAVAGASGGPLIVSATAQTLARWVSGGVPGSESRACLEVASTHLFVPQHTLDGVMDLCVWPHVASAQT